MGERSLDECAALRPAGCIDVEAGISAFLEEARDGDVGNADLAEQETFGGQLSLEIIERRRNILVERLFDPHLVRGSPHTSGCTILLVEEAPDEQVTEPRVGKFLEPSGAGAVPGSRREEANGQDRRRRDRRR